MAEGFRFTDKLTDEGKGAPKHVRRVTFTTSFEADAAAAAAKKVGISQSEWTRRAVRRALIQEGHVTADVIAPFLSEEEKAKTRDLSQGTKILAQKLMALRSLLLKGQVADAVTTVDDILNMARGK